MVAQLAHRLPVAQREHDFVRAGPGDVHADGGERVDVVLLSGQLVPALVRLFHPSERTEAVFIAGGELAEHAVLVDGGVDTHGYSERPKSADLTVAVPVPTAHSDEYV